MSNCPTCGRGDDDTEMLLVQLRVELQDSESERKRLLRSNKLLKAEMARNRKKSPKAHDAKRLYEHWVDRLGKNANVVFGEAREKACLSMLDLFPVETLLRAIDGLAKFPYDAGYGKRSHVPVGGHPRRDDLTFVFANEIRVETFAKLAEDDEDHVDPIELRPAGPVKPAVAALRAKFGEDVFEWFDGWWWSPCPLHPYEGAAPFRLREDPRAPGLLEVQCAKRCGRDALLAAVGVAGDLEPQQRLAA